MSQLEVFTFERREDDIAHIPIVLDDQNPHGPSIPDVRTFLHLCSRCSMAKHARMPSTRATLWVPSARNKE